MAKTLIIYIYEKSRILLIKIPEIPRVSSRIMELIHYPDLRARF